MTMKLIKEKAPTDFKQQIILYSKEWYNKSENPIDDLKILLKKYSGYIGPGSESIVKKILAETFATYAHPRDIKEAILEMLEWNVFPPIKSQTPESIMLSKLSIISGAFVDVDQKLDVLQKDHKTIMKSIPILEEDECDECDECDAETDMEDRLEQERRDEKNGVYPDKWNDAN